jgi:hypothetical protein
MVGILGSALATRTCSLATPAVIEQHHDSQCAKDLKSVQYRIAPIASNSPTSSTNTYSDRLTSAAAAQILPARASACARRFAEAS